MARIRIVPTVSLLIALFVFGSLSFLAVGRVKQRALEFSQVALQRLTWAGQVNGYQAEGYIRTLQFLHSDNPEDRSALRSEMENYRDRTSAVLATYSRTFTTQESRRLYQEFMDKRAAYHKVREQVVVLSDQGRKDDALQLARSSLWQAYEHYSRAGDVLFDFDISTATTSADSIVRLCTITQFMAAFISVIGFFGGIAVPFVLMWLSHSFRDDPLHP